MALVKDPISNLANARTHMANERTHLAYLRTSLSLITFGITLNRFSIFLRSNKTHPHLQVHGPLYQSELVGIMMVAVGIIILCWALFRYIQVTKEIESDTYSSPKKALIIITAIILILGGFSTAWMFFTSV